VSVHARDIGLGNRRAVGKVRNFGRRLAQIRDQTYEELVRLAGSSISGASTLIHGRLSGGVKRIHAFSRHFNERRSRQIAGPRAFSAIVSFHNPLKNDDGTPSVRTADQSTLGRQTIA